MADFKNKYMRAVKELDEAEKEAASRIQTLYQASLSILKELKGRHPEVDIAINQLPGKISMDGQTPIEELSRIREMVGSYFDRDTEVAAGCHALGALLSMLKLSDDLHEGAEVIEKSLVNTQTQKELAAIGQKIAALVIKNLGKENASLREDIDSIKRGLMLQLAQLEEQDVELAGAIGMTDLRKHLDKVEDVKALERFYKQVFERLRLPLAKKNQFIVELSGLVETVVHQLAELTLDLKKEGAHELEAHKDRWRLTELMGGQINTLQNSVLQSENLDVLKSVLTERLGEFNQTVVKFTELEEARANEAEKYALSVTNKLNQLELEASDLKRSLDQAHEEALVDVLTGIPNRRAYDERIRLEYERWKRHKEPLLLAILDIDHFKKINDSYGHSIGDKVLCTIAQLINKQVRNSDFFGRIGGEEFAIIFTGSDLNNSMKRLNQFRQLVENCKFGYKGKRIVITTSIGCAQFSEGDDPESTYDRADKVLYKAKQTGRNKCLSELDL